MMPASIPVTRSSANRSLRAGVIGGSLDSFTCAISLRDRPWASGRLSSLKRERSRCARQDRANCADGKKEQERKPVSRLHQKDPDSGNGIDGRGRFSSVLVHRQGPPDVAFREAGHCGGELTRYSRSASWRRKSKEVSVWRRCRAVVIHHEKR